ncbi:hypothetical protein LTR56_000076 [Elasticomyces elasticus]|nr:hypothetical protein LTR56_000076 [Elasticomyces elasticus]KAK3667064.1 hypothetical protein LTR22_001928 [Elasticomyces elasticus]KAK4932839.1 hypothetical protein LTR49_000795 [Elasticomyces elasticus]KAK5768757.1 hypothetical protein LTS12_001183 [Elasticomyces elasticus]
MAPQATTLVSLNKTPARAAMLVELLLAKLRPEYDIIHVANSPKAIETLETVLSTLVQPPGILICSSQWSDLEQEKANNIARGMLADIDIVNIPPGMDVHEGGEAIIAFLERSVRGLGGA